MPCLMACYMSARIDTTLVEILHALSPLNNWEALNGGACMQDCTYFLSRFQGQFNCLGELRHHVSRRHRLDREPL